MAKILIIEDETILKEEVIEWLTLEGHHVMGAEDGLKGVEIAFNFLPDLVVSDITMPNLDGYGVLLELRAHPETADTPFIFVTARAAYDDVRTGMNLGADDYITKPFTRIQLLEAVNTRLEKKIYQEEKYHYELERWQKALNDEREQRLLKARLIAMFSHDIRTPLSSVLASSSIIRNYEDRLTPERKLHHLDQIDGAVHLMLQMLDDMLIVAEIENGHLEYRPEPVEIQSFVTRIVEEFQLIHQKTHKIRLECSAQNVLQLDPKLFRHVLTNLISNAVKYSPKESEVLVCIENYPNSFRLKVQDSGIGIPASDLDHLFEAFFRAENAKRMKGTGLGLSIAKYAIDLHGGRISVDSQEGVGTTFTIDLVQTPVDEGAL